MTTPQQARAIADILQTDIPAVAVNAFRSLADQVEALTAQLDSYAMALNETKAERDSYKKDAERYRWLRAGDYSIALSRSILNDTPHGIDKTIDAAIAKGTA